MLVNGSIRSLVQFLVSPNMEPINGFDCTAKCTDDQIVVGRPVVCQKRDLNMDKYRVSHKGTL